MYGGRAMPPPPPPMGSCAIKYSACMYVHVHLTDFLKINLTKFAVVWVKERPKRPVFWAREAPKEKGEKDRARKKGGEETKKFCTLSFYNGYFGEIFCRKKAVSSEGLSGDNVFKNAARYTPLAHLPCTLKVSTTLCISTVFNFFWDGCNTQEKWKTKGMQNFGGQIRCIRKMYKWLIQHLINMCVYGTLNWPKNLFKMYCFSFPIIFHKIFFDFFDFFYISRSRAIIKKLTLGFFQRYEQYCSSPKHASPNRPIRFLGRVTWLNLSFLVNIVRWSFLLV